MAQQNYLLCIDHEPLNENLKNYFLQFNIDIIQHHQLQSIPNTVSPPIALLIHWSFLKTDLKLIHRLYTNCFIPLIIMSDTPDEGVCIKVLEAGADDFLVKPLNPRELHARISAINRRVLRAKSQMEHEKEVYAFSNWLLYPTSRQIFSTTNEELLLSTGEYDLLLKFIQQPNQILDRELLLHVTKHNDSHPFDRRINVQISRLRQKIDVDAKRPSLIKTIRNGGYMFTAEVRILKVTE